VTSRRTTRVRPPRLARTTALLGAGAFLVAGAALVITGVTTLGRNPAGAGGLIALGVVVLACAELLRRLAHPLDRMAPLTILVGGDEIGFQRHGEVVDRVERAEVGLVVLEGFGRAGLCAVTVQGPDGQLVGRWETGWLQKSALRAWLALRRHGWPRAIQDRDRMRWVSRGARRPTGAEPMSGRGRPW
jgi:hypothetical protein